MAVEFGKTAEDCARHRANVPEPLFDSCEYTRAHVGSVAIPGPNVRGEAATTRANRHERGAMGRK